MVRAALSLYQPPVAEEPPALVKFPAPTPTAPLADRLAMARSANEAGDLVAAGVLSRTIIEQRIRQMADGLKLSHASTDAANLLVALAEAHVIGHTDRQTLAAGLTIGNVAAHMKPGLDSTHIDVALAAAQRAMSNVFGDPPSRTNTAAPPTKAERKAVRLQLQAAKREKKRQAWLAKVQAAKVQAAIIDEMMQGGAA